MGMYCGCCCQKTEPTNRDDLDTCGAKYEAVNDAADDALHEKKRERGRKGNEQRIGNKAYDDSDDGTSAYLAKHRRPRDKGKETRKLIRNAMKSDRVCALLEEREIETILETMEYFQFAKEEPVVQQGENGTTFFVTHEGSLKVSVNSNVVNTMSRGKAFGGLSLLYNCPRTASVIAASEAGVWGANGATFHGVLMENAKAHYRENRKFLDSISLFDGLPVKQKDHIGEAFFVEAFEPGARVVTEGEIAPAMYFVKKGDLRVLKGVKVQNDGKVIGGTFVANLGPGDCFGERGLLYNEPRGSTVVVDTSCELLCIGADQLKEVLGDDLNGTIERNVVLTALKKSPVFSQFSGPQQHTIAQGMQVRVYATGASIEPGMRFAIVVDGSVEGKNEDKPVTLPRGSWYEDDAIIGGNEDLQHRKTVDVQQVLKSLDQKKGSLCDLVGGPKGARVGVLTQDALSSALKNLGLSTEGSTEQAMDYTRKMALAKKVHIFRQLSEEQTDRLVRSFKLEKYKKGQKVIKQGEIGRKFYVVESGEVKVVINGNDVRTLAKNAYFGERALLFEEPRSADVQVSSSEAEFWSVAKGDFTSIVKGKMQQELLHRIRLQDTNVTMKDLKHMKVIGAGAAGVVRLVEHKTTHTQYALKRVLKNDGDVPEEVQRECALLKENSHPFIMYLVKTFETKKSVYMLTELITGGELHAAIRKIPTVLSRPQAHFYAGSLLLVLEELQDRNIVFRDLKPENVMLDQQGYLKLIDFGIAKKLEEGKLRTFTMIGTPHYMAPEVMRGHGYGTGVDIWSLGVMLFEFVCGYLPFADELDDPTEVCTAVLKEPLVYPTGYRDQMGRSLMSQMLCRQPKKRICSGINGFDDIKNCEYFTSDYSSGSTLFNKIMGRELDPPVVPIAETYCDPDDVADITLSDAGELG